MEHYIFPIFLLLLFSVLFTGKFMEQYRIRLIGVRQVITLVGLVFYVFWFTKGFISENTKDAYSVEIRNKLPQAIDFYLIKVTQNSENPGTTDKETLHSGKIRPEYYRLERLQMKDAHELWLIGFLGKDNMVYFSQHIISNKNIDAIIEVENYLLGSKQLSEEGKKAVKAHVYTNNRNAIWISLSLLFIFINLYVLPKKWVKRKAF